MKRIYLDYAATTPLHPQVLEAMLPYYGDAFGNPSAVHSYGLEAKEAIAEARAKVAGLIGARAEEIVFTGGGSEADNHAIKGTAFANAGRGNHIITSSVEHHAVIETCRFLETQGFKVTYLPVDEYGMVNPDDVANAIGDKTILISVMHANNEVGTIQPIAEIGRIARGAGVCLHTDAVQTAGHMPLDVNELGVDLLSMSAHKLYGSKGVGALYVGRGTRLSPLMHGGEQENGRRAGTENVPGIVGFGRAAEIAGQEINEEAKRLTSLRDKFIRGILESSDGIRLNGHPAKRLPGNVNISIADIDGEAIMLNLDLEGICIATGSACSTSAVEPSHVLKAMGLSTELSHSALRITLGKWTDTEAIDRVLEVLPSIVSRLRTLSPLRKNRQKELP